MKRIEITIPVLVGSNGKWCANGYDSMKNPAEDADWGFMADALDSSAPNQLQSEFPAVERRYLVRAVVVVPDAEPSSVDATAVETVE